MTAVTRAAAIAIGGFAEVLGTRLLAEEPDRVSVLMPYSEQLGVERIHGGAISALVAIGTPVKSSNAASHADRITTRDSAAA